MRLQAVGAFLALCASALANNVVKSSPDAAAPQKRIFVVEFDNPTPAQSYSTERVAQVHDVPHVAFEQFLQKNAADNYKIRFRFTDPRFLLATSVELAGDSGPSLLHKFPGTVRVHEARQYQLSGRLPRNFAREESVAGGRATKGDLHLRAADPASPATVDMLDSHRLIGLDKIFAEGHFGKGQVVASLDSGIDYTHHALNGGRPDGEPCFGPGCKVIGGWAFYQTGGGNYTFGTDPFDPCGGHGTSTAGMVIANAPDRNFTGSAPEASLLAYRIFGCHYGPYDDQIVAAMQRAFLEGADVITMSFTRAGGFADDGLPSQLVPKLDALGVASVTGTNNNGLVGHFNLGAPCSASEITAVGSVQAPSLVAQKVKLVSASGEQLGTVSYISALPFVPSPAVRPVYVTPTNACEELPADTPDLSKMVAIFPQLDDYVCNFYTQIGNLKKKGADVIFVQNFEDQFISSPEEPTIVTILSSDADPIRDLIKKGVSVSVDFSEASLTSLSPGHWAGKLDPWSGLGPTWDLRPAVTLLGVGGGVLSTGLVKKQLYEVDDGVSGAAPMVAGLYAVYRGIKGKTVDPSEMRRVFSTTATILIEDGTNGVPNSVNAQGNGLVNIFNAVKSITRVWPDFLNLNDTRHFNGTQTLHVKNVGQQPQSFKLSHIPAGTFHPYVDSRQATYTHGIAHSVPGEQASVTFSPHTFDLRPGQVQAVTVKVTPPAVNQVAMSIYSGFVNISSNQDFGSVHAAYLGVAGDMALVPIFNTTVPPSILDANGKVVTEPDVTFSINASSTSPSFTSNFVSGTRLAALDLVSANVTLDSIVIDKSSPSTIFPAYVVGHAARINSWTNWARDVWGISKTPISSKWTDAQNVTQAIQSGHYRVLLRGLKHFGDIHNPADYEAHLSIPFHLEVNP